MADGKLPSRMEPIVMSPLEGPARAAASVPSTTAAIAPSTAAVLNPSAITGSPAARWGAWLMVLSPLYFVAVVVANVATLTSAKIGPYAEITRSQMDVLGAGWVLLNVMFPLAVVAGTVGCALAALALVRTHGAGTAWARAAVASAALSVLGMAPYAPFRIAAMGFTEPTLGDNGLFSVWDMAGMFAFGLAIVAVALLCAAMYFSGVRRTPALVVGVLAVVCGIATLAMVPLPPFIISFLWLALGIIWLRGIRRN